MIDPQEEMLLFAKQYLYLQLSTLDRLPIDSYKLNRSLNYVLCRAYQRQMGMFGEFPKRDVAAVIEAWIIKAHNSYLPPKAMGEPLLKKGTPDG